MPRCRICKAKYTPTRSMQPTCGEFACMVAYADQVAAKGKAKREATGRKEKAADKRKTRQRLDAIKTIPQLIADADTAFMAYIRARDQAAGYPCISSGRPLDWTGNAVDAGHYRSRGAASHLRYDEANCNAQSKHDNRWLGGNVVAYRVGLIARAGIAEVERIESDNTPHKWTREELIEIAKKYRQKKKDIKTSCHNK